MVTSFHKPTSRDKQGSRHVGDGLSGIPEPIRITRAELAALDAAFGARPARGRVVNADLVRPSPAAVTGIFNIYFSNRRGMMHPPSPG